MIFYYGFNQIIFDATEIYSGDSSFKNKIHEWNSCIKINYHKNVFNFEKINFLILIVYF